MIDLVAASGIDVSDWGNFAKGPEHAASNPKYCYEWAFSEPHKVVVLCLWHDELLEHRGRVFQRLNYRKHAASLPKAAARGAWAKRSRTIDAEFGLAWAQALPVRVIVCAGKMGDVLVNPANSSKVHRRMLDPIPWAVTTYDNNTGHCEVTRGIAPVETVDQFSGTNGDRSPERRTVTGQVIVRDSAVRRRVLARARGFCELCSQAGFTTASGAVYLETHHIVSLAQNGEDTDSNVTALCPNDHRKAHHGVEQDALRARLQRLVEAKLRVAK